jgi:DNA repair protein RadD
MSKKWIDGQTLAEYLMSAEMDHIRGVTFQIPKSGLPVPSLYPHQEEALTQLMARPVSTILHLPTGSGKTRVALELIARVLQEAPKTKIVWASYPTTLIRQSMARLAQLSSNLPEGLRFCWAKSDTQSRSVPDLLTDHEVIFALRGTLTGLLRDVGDRPNKSPLRSLLSNGTPLLIIYDECHQLGARSLQRSWRILDRKRPVDSVWPRIVGLSATPLPRNPRRRTLLRKTLFPMHPTTPQDPDYPWRMDVAHRVHNARLEKMGVLCPINAYQQRSGFFDIPLEVLDRASRRRLIKEPPVVGATGNDLMQFSAQFNARIMTHPLVLRFLAGRIATRIEELGKTLVFLPTIRAANGFVELLEAHPATRGRVFLVHTRLGEIEQDGPPLRVFDQLQGFIKQGNKPCVMVNVNMLTTGFDDPKIRTIVLARLTYSMNLYWQMIGRGSRGPKSGGTTDCTVLDPIRLTRLYPIAEGYRPTLTQSNEDMVAGEEVGAGRLDPSLTIVENPNRVTSSTSSFPSTSPTSPTSSSVEVVEDSWFDTVELDEEALTAYQAPPPKQVRTQVKTETATLGPALSIEEGLKRNQATAKGKAGAWSRLWVLIVVLDENAFQRVTTAFGIPFVGKMVRDETADEIMDALYVEGRSGATTFFGAIPSTELRRLVRSLGLTSTTNKKSAFVTSLIHDFLLDDPIPPLKELLATDDVPKAAHKPGELYKHLEGCYDKRGLQKLLDRLKQPRSGKNKSVLIQRIFETFLFGELSR